MTKEDYSVFCETWLSVEEVTAGNKKLSDGSLFLIFKALSKYNIREIVMACGVHILQCKFMCTPAHIVEIIEGNNSSKADTAWTIIFNAITSVGQYGTIDLSYCEYSQAIAYAVDMEGWQNICCAEEKEMKWIEKRFKDRFNYAVNKSDMNVCLIQSGIHDIANVGKGFNKQIAIPLNDTSVLMFAEAKKLQSKINQVDDVVKKLSM
jgi:hypothetical protein